MPTARKTGTTPNAINLLMDDHKAVKALFKDYEKLAKDEADGEEKQALAQQICMMLTTHTQLEEEMFYPAAREALGEEEADLVDEALVEHDSAKQLIEQIEGASPEDELYDAKVQVLGEYVRHHIKEEEEEMFPKLKKTELDLRVLGEAMAEQKQALESTNT
jgi:hemerythrin superfamily protein